MSIVYADYDSLLSLCFGCKNTVVVLNYVSKTFEETDKIDNIDEARPSTSIHGAVTSLSPIKKGKKSVFFIADKTSQIRLVGLIISKSNSLFN